MPVRFVGTRAEAAVAVHAPAASRAQRSMARLFDPDLGRVTSWAAALEERTEVSLEVIAPRAAHHGWKAAADRGELFDVLPRISPGGDVQLDLDGRRALSRRGATVEVRASDVPDPVRPDVFLHIDDRGARIGILREPREGHDDPVERLWIFEDPHDSEHLDALAAELSPTTAAASHADASQDAPSADLHELRPYQRQAIDRWLSAGANGVFVMATGTGKTFTAIRASDELARVTDRGLAVVIMVPQVHIADQWGTELGSDGHRHIVCHTSTSTWIGAASREIDLLRAGHRERVTLVSTYASAQLPAFQELIGRIDPSDLLVIVDEAHHFARRVAELPDARYRLGLTATPELDAHAGPTEGILGYFGSVVASYQLADAIADGVLCPYDYQPHPVELTDDELGEFRAITEQLRELTREHASRRDHRAVAALLDRRSETLDQARGKLELLRELVDRKMPDRTIIYCSGRPQLEAVTALCWELGVTAHQLTAEESAGQRQELLDRFAEGGIPVLTAIRCLDEGVDVPGAREAYLLRSSANPTQSVQRRGRLLRKAPGKRQATIHDLVTVGADRQLAQLERERVRRFAAEADNRDDAIRRSDSFWEVGA